MVMRTMWNESALSVLGSRRGKWLFAIWSTSVLSVQMLKEISSQIFISLLMVQ